MSAIPVEPLPPGAKFPLGRVVVTPTAAAWLPAEVIARALERHQAGDWGDASAEIACENDEGIAGGGPLISCYFKDGAPFQIATDGHREATTLKMSWEWSP